jgi:8-oxo-dGTP pyrophosphatase MutT (NUDIX family)
MKLNTEIVKTPPRAAATVLLLRDSPVGLEVFMLKRHGESDVLGGAHVFPGGKVDISDHGPEALQCQAASPEELKRALAESQLDAASAAALYYAACRETFEECGVLLVRDAGAETLRQAKALAAEGYDFAEMLTGLRLQLEGDDLQPWSRWITPVVPSMSSKRFDTRFFVVGLPPDQHPTHDNREASDSAWFGPREALERYWDHEIHLAPPQLMSLAHLSRHRTVAEVLSEAGRRDPPIIQPEPFEWEGHRVVAYPGDERHPLKIRALPGPTRLVYRGTRFEPVEGFEAFFE